MKNEKLIKLKDVLQIIPVSKSTWYEGIRKGIFPKPVKIKGLNSSFWRKSDIEKIVEDKMNT